jgi:cyclomaltodextrinase
LSTAAGEPFTKVTNPQLRLRAPSEEGEYYVALEVIDEEGRSDTSVVYFVVEGGRARAVNMMTEHPSWIDNAVIYAPISILWGNGGPRAVQRKLPYLKKLGVDALWLWPPATERAFGEQYAITDYFKLDPSWGPMPAFKELVDEAHRLGFHVLVDFVPNHMSDQSPYFKDAERAGEASRYWDFFDRKPNGAHTHYFDWTNLPNLNYDNPEVRRMVMEAMSYWVRDLDIDGFRVDVAWGVKRRRPEFWLEWRRELKRINPDLMLIAEATAIEPYYFTHGFDVGYDWTDSPGQWAWGSVFDFPEETGALLAPALTNQDKGYHRDAIVMRFLNNNDTGIRFVDQHGPKLTRVAATLQFTVPGIPEMFAGDEIGASYEPYSNLTPIPWQDRYGLRPFYETLIDLKHNTPALNSREMEILTTNLNSVLAYVRPGVGTTSPVLVLLNFGSSGRVQIERSPALDQVLAAFGGSLRDVLSGKTVALPTSGRVTLPMAAESSLVLMP